MTGAPPDPEPAAGAADVAALLARLEARGDADTSATVRALLDEVLAMHRHALTRALDALAASGPGGADALGALARDERVASVLLLHGLHPEPLEARVRGTLAALERELRGLDATVTLAALEGAAARLGLQGGGAARGRIRAMIEEALYATAPDLDGVAWEASGEDGGFVPLARLLAPRDAGPSAPRAETKGATEAETCELCGRALAARHDHVLEPERFELRCACPACAVLFSAREGAKWKRVEHRVAALPELRLDDAAWSSLAIPVDVAFLTRHGDGARVVARYPGAAGATEAPLAAATWDALVAQNPVLGALEPDVEALLVNRLDGAREHYRASIDECFALVGLLRRHWRGFTGGAEVRAELARYFEALRTEAGVKPCAG